MPSSPWFDRGSVSPLEARGLTSRCRPTSGGWTGKLVLDDVVHRSQVDLVASHRTEAVTNPHFTFHPPGYVHLRANGHGELFAGLLMIDLMVEHDGRFPWIRFVSNPVETLAPLSGSRAKGTADVIRLLASSRQCSIELAVDFVAPGSIAVPSAAGFDARLEWQGRVLHLYANHQPGRWSTLSWNHSS